MHKMGERPRINRDCWGKKSSACEGGASNEHVISKGVLQAIGAKSLRHTSREHGSRNYGGNSLTVPMLCRKHNTALSPLDTEASKFFGGIRALFTSPVSGVPFANAGSTAELLIDGKKLERWATKTFLNMFISDYALSPKKKLPFTVDSFHAYRRVFLEEPPEGRAGFYALPIGTNLLKRTPHQRSAYGFTLITKEVQIVKKVSGAVHGPYRFPAFLYIDLFKFEFLLHENLTPLNAHDWGKVMEDYWKDERFKMAVKQPQQARFDIPHLDGAKGGYPKRAIRFVW
jgi:hypothetical protein